MKELRNFQWIPQDCGFNISFIAFPTTFEKDHRPKLFRRLDYSHIQKYSS